MTRSDDLEQFPDEDLGFGGEHKDDLRAWLRLCGATTVIETQIRSRLREEFAFTLPRFDMLALLEHAPEGLVLGEISRRLLVTPGNVTSICEKLIEDGYVLRTPSPNDKRVQIVRMTRAGRAAFKIMASAHSEWVARIFAGLSSKDRSELLRILKVLRKSASVVE